MTAMLTPGTLKRAINSSMVRPPRSFGPAVDCAPSIVAMYSAAVRLCASTVAGTASGSSAAATIVRMLIGSSGRYDRGLPGANVVAEDAGVNPSVAFAQAVRQGLILALWAARHLRRRPLTLAPLTNAAGMFNASDADSHRQRSHRP